MSDLDLLQVAGSEANDLFAWTTDAVSHLSGPDQAEWLERIDARYKDLLQQLNQYHRESNLVQGLRLASLLGRFFWMRGRAREGGNWLEHFLTRTLGITLARAEGKLALGGLLYAQANYRVAKESLETACKWFELLQYLPGKAATLNQLGMIERETGNLSEAQKLHEQARTLYAEKGDEYGVVSCVSNLGVVALFGGDLDTAERLHREALQERRRLGDLRGIASCIASLGNVARWRGDYPAARKNHDEALAMRSQLKDPWGVAGSLVNLGVLACLLEQYDASVMLLGQAQKGFLDVRDKLGLCEVLDARAELTAAQGHPAEAVRLFSAVERAREEIMAPLPVVARSTVKRRLRGLKEALGDVYAKAWKMGQAGQYSPFAMMS